MSLPPRLGHRPFPQRSTGPAPAWQSSVRSWAHLRRAALIEPVQQGDVPEGDAIAHLRRTSASLLAALSLPSEPLNEAVLPRTVDAREPLVTQEQTFQPQPSTRVPRITAVSHPPQSPILSPDPWDSDPFADYEPYGAAVSVSERASQASVRSGPSQAAANTARPAVSLPTAFVPRQAGSWSNPAQLSTAQLVECVYALEKSGHVPSGAWMAGCLSACERAFQEHTHAVTMAAAAAAVASVASAAPSLSTAPAIRKGQKHGHDTPSHIGVSQTDTPHPHLHTKQHLRPSRPPPASQLATPAYPRPRGSQASRTHTESLSWRQRQFLLTEQQLCTLVWGVAKLYQRQREQWVAASSKAGAAAAAAAQARPRRGGRGRRTGDRAPTSRFQALVGHTLTQPETQAERPWAPPNATWLRALQRAADCTYADQPPQPAAAAAGTHTHTPTPPATHTPSHQQAVSHGAQWLVTLPWALATMRSAPEAAWLATWLTRAKEGMGGLRSRDVGQLAWALAELRYRPAQAWMQAMLARVQALAEKKKLAARDLAMVLWACAKLRYDCGALFAHTVLESDVLRACCAGPAAARPAQDLTLVLWSLATLRRAPGLPAMHTVLGLLDRHLPSLCQQDLAMLLWSLAQFQYDPPVALGQRIVATVDRNVFNGAVTPRSLPVVMWALAKLKWRIPRAVRSRLVQAACDLAPHTSPLGIALAFTLITQQPAYLRSKALMQALVHATRAAETDTHPPQPSSPPCNGQAAPNASDESGLAAGNGAATVTTVLASTAAVVRDSATGSSSRKARVYKNVWAGCSCRAAAMVLAGFARCAYAPPAAWMRQFWSGTLTTLPSASQGDLHLLIWAHSALSCSPPRVWRDAVTQRAMQLQAQGQLGPKVISWLVKYHYLGA